MKNLHKYFKTEETTLILNKGHPNNVIIDKKSNNANLEKLDTKTINYKLLCSLHKFDSHHLHTIIDLINNNFFNKNILKLGIIEDVADMNPNCINCQHYIRSLGHCVRFNIQCSYSYIGVNCSSKKTLEDEQNSIIQEQICQ